MNNWFAAPRSPSVRSAIVSGGGGRPPQYRWEWGWEEEGRRKGRNCHINPLPSPLIPSSTTMTMILSSLQIFSNCSTEFTRFGSRSLFSCGRNGVTHKGCKLIIDYDGYGWKYGMKLECQAIENARDLGIFLIRWLWLFVQLFRISDKPIVKRWFLLMN